MAICQLCFNIPGCLTDRKLVLPFYCSVSLYSVFLLLSGCVHPQQKKRGLSAQVGEKSKTWNLHWPLPRRERKLMFLRENTGVGLCRRLGGWMVFAAPLDGVDNWVSTKLCQPSSEAPFQLKEMQWEWWSERERVRTTESERGWRRKKILGSLRGESRYWKAIKLAFSKIDWKWRGLLKPRDKRTIVCFWPPYVALLSPSCCPPTSHPVCLNTPGPKKKVSEGFSTSWIDPSLSTTGTLFSYLTTQK